MKFKVIVADNPWLYRNTRTGGSLKSGSAHKYSTLSLQDLCELSVKDIADKNALLFLWVPVPLKYEIATSGLLESWNFKYLTTIYWRKINTLGLGYNFRGAIEECWMCKRGAIPSFRTRHPNFIETNVIETKPGKHSEKPKEFFELIEPSIERLGLYPCLEVFARKKRPKWISIGNEISGNDIRVDLKNLIDGKVLDCYEFH